ncbi:carboxymuconolactone decarboxylase family protein [Flavobacteriaceae bacterium]|jgi:AhpD family alkylhydroperoxidase|nr:carboxymuconolactone decarboxylase family protein [Flavobacteriaceae bacterium]MDB2389057.1 carboxymuconolactone decarboxylase family protein [Flavobacteriaceae bacterium]
MGQSVEEFNAYRQRMNERLMQEDQKILKRVFNLDTNAYMEGHLPVKTKELLGLGNSLVLRCDDCVKYHLQTCFELGISKEEVVEAMSISLLIGGTIVIPHLRRAVEFWDDLNGQAS